MKNGHKIKTFDLKSCLSPIKVWSYSNGISYCYFFISYFLLLRCHYSISPKVHVKHGWSKLIPEFPFEFGAFRDTGWFFMRWKPMCKMFCYNARSFECLMHIVSGGEYIVKYNTVVTPLLYTCKHMQLFVINQKKQTHVA